mmetsp:Transcript_64513/g.185497  ORF Transcript_64513/g.185497 Transcript_64513/m.185497 type:complete len:307 (-) Transcript_64513:1215-2135(-)
MHAWITGRAVQERLVDCFIDNVPGQGSAIEREMERGRSFKRGPLLLATRARPQRVPRRRAALRLRRLLAICIAIVIFRRASALRFQSWRTCAQGSPPLAFLCIPRLSQPRHRNGHWRPVRTRVPEEAGQPPEHRHVSLRMRAHGHHGGPQVLKPRARSGTQGCWPPGRGRPAASAGLFAQLVQEASGSMRDQDLQVRRRGGAQSFPGGAGERVVGPALDLLTPPPPEGPPHASPGPDLHPRPRVPRGARARRAVPRIPEAIPAAARRRRGRRHCGCAATERGCPHRAGAQHDGGLDVVERKAELAI